MNNRFYTLLVPVDFSPDSEAAIQKAVAICADQGASIHLLHVVKSPLSRLARIFATRAEKRPVRAEQEARERMDRLVFALRKRKKNISIHGWVVSGKPETVIAGKARELAADLVIITKRSRPSLLPFRTTIAASRLAQVTGIAVLTVRPGDAIVPIRTIVVPVMEELSDKKMEMILALRKKTWIHICLVSFTRDGNPSNVFPMALLNTYRRLRSGMNNEVSCKILRGTSKGRAILRYCEEVHADLLIATPASETRIGWLNKPISDALPLRLKTQVLAVQAS